MYALKCTRRELQLHGKQLFTFTNLGKFAHSAWFRPINSVKTRVLGLRFCTKTRPMCLLLFMPSDVVGQVSFFPRVLGKPVTPRLSSDHTRLSIPAALSLLCAYCFPILPSSSCIMARSAMVSLGLAHDLVQKTTQTFFGFFFLLLLKVSLSPLNLRPIPR